MEIEISDVSAFKDLMSMIGSLMADVSLDLSPEGLSIKAMDPANIAMIIFDAKDKFFDKFDVKSATKLSVSLDDLNGILRFVKPGEHINIKDSKGRLNISILGKRSTNFVIPLISDDYTASKIPQLKFTATIELISNIIKTGVKMASTVDDAVYFTVDNNKFIISSRNSDKEFSEEFDINIDKEIFNISSEGLTKSKYSTDYLSKFLSILDDERPVKLMFSNSYPLRMDYSFGNALLSFILANRIE